MFKRGRVFYARYRRAGKTVWKSLSADRGEAERMFRRMRADDAPSSSLTVKAAAERWLETRIATGRNEEGLTLARARVKKYLTPFFGSQLLSRVEREDLRRYRLALEKKVTASGRPIALQTVAHILADARALFLWAEDAGLIDRSPVPRRLLPRIPERAPNRFTDEEVERLTALHDPHGFVIRFMLATGLRWGEACRAQASDVRDGMLLVHRETKSRKVRRVPLSPEIQQELRGRVGRLVPYSVASKGSFNRDVRRVSGVEQFHSHRCRHTFGCRWIERGGTLESLQEIMGHASIATTQIYARLGERAVRAEAERVFASHV